MSLGWIEGRSYSINSLLLMDRYIIRVIAGNQYSEFVKNLGIVLAYNPAIHWYFINKCPECREYFIEIINGVSDNISKEELRDCEIYVLEYIDWAVVYMYPSVMEKLDYISLWDEDRLLTLTDFKDKKVLDIGSGTGRLAFTVAPIVEWVYAIEPVDILRDYMRDKAKLLNFNNIYVIDGTIERLPFPDNTFDIIISGHVIGDNVDAEYEEMCRVLKNEGYIIDCPGEEERKRPNGPSAEMIRKGFEYSHYTSKVNGDVYRYWKQIYK